MKNEAPIKWIWASNKGISIPLLTGVFLLTAYTQEPATSTDLRHSTPAIANKVAIVDKANSHKSNKQNNTTKSAGNVNPGGTLSDQHSAEQLLNRLITFYADDDPSLTVELMQIKLSLHEMGYDTLSAIVNLMRNELPNSATWENSREQILLKVLLGLKLPEVEFVALEWLGHRPSPMAVVRLSRYLASQAPGRYNREIRQAAERVVLSAESSKEELGPLFQLLGEFGDQETIALLLNTPMQHDAYASVALALIPDGSGIPMLEQDARLFESGYQTVHGRLAIELLAQQSHQFENAASIILDLAAQGLIPSDIWPRVLAIVSGERQITLDPPAQGMADSHTIFRPDGDQTLYLVPRDPGQDQSIWTYQRFLMLEELLQLAPYLTADS